MGGGGWRCSNAIGYHYECLSPVLHPDHLPRLSGDEVCCSRLTNGSEFSWERQWWEDIRRRNFSGKEDAEMRMAEQEGARVGWLPGPAVSPQAPRAGAVPHTLLFPKCTTQAPIPSARPLNPAEVLRRCREGLAPRQLWPNPSGALEAQGCQSCQGGCSGWGLVHSGRPAGLAKPSVASRHRLPGWAEPRAGLDGADPGERPLWKAGNCLPCKETKLRWVSLALYSET